MSADDLTPKTKREVLMCREVFIEACQVCVNYFGWEYNAPRYATWPGSRTLAEMSYPLPKVIRVREVPDVYASDVRWRVCDGDLQVKEWSGGFWKSTNMTTARFEPHPERVALWHDLYKNPTETVEDDTP